MIGEKLHNRSVTTKLMVAVLLVLAVTLAGGTFVLQAYVKNKMTDTYLESVHNLFNSFQEGVKGSLERGQMKSFQKLLSQQNDVPGVLDVSLYDKNGVLNLSSSGGEITGKELQPDIKAVLYEKKNTIEDVNRGDVRVVSPQIIVADCIRCHLDWKEGEIGGSLSMTYDLTALNTSVANLKVILVAGCLFLLLITSNGVELLGATETAFKNAVGRSGETANFLEEITAASKEQSLSINHVSTAIHELDKVTQENSLNAEGASRIASDMKLQARRLNSFMEKLVELVKGRKSNPSSR